MKDFFILPGKNLGILSSSNKVIVDSVYRSIFIIKMH